MQQKTKIAIADDNNRLLLQIKENLLASDLIEIIFLANNGKEVLDNIISHESLPEVILMDIEMPIMDGIETTAIITKETDIKVLILTVFDNDDKIFDAIKAGAAGYLLKDSKAITILNAIEDVLNGGAPMSPGIASKTLNLLRNKTITNPDNLKPSDFKLSEREIDLLEQLVQGLSYKQIGEKLFISHGTVRKHIQNIYEKLHIHNKVEAVNKVKKHKWFGS